MPTPRTLARVSQRVAAIAESATLAVDAKAKALKAAGEPVIGFGAGEPDFPTPAHIVEAAVEAARDPKNHKYTPGRRPPGAEGGHRRQDAARLRARRAGRARCSSPTAASTPSTTPSPRSSTPATRCSSRRRTGPPTPSRSRSTGGVPVVLPTDETTGFRVTVDQLDAAVTDRTKALLFVSPSNPTGAVYPVEEVEAIGRWAVERGIWVITDEIYEHLTYGDNTFSSMPELVPDLREQCVVLNGVAKTYAMTGWRVGWMIGPDDVIKAATNLQSHATSNVANVSQRAALAAVSGDLTAVAEMRAAFERRGHTMHQLLTGIEGVTALEPQGAFYGFPNLSHYLGKTIRGRTSETTLDLCSVLLDEAKVAIVPGEAFDAPGYARLSYALGDDDLGEGCRRIADLLAEAE